MRLFKILFVICHLLFVIYLLPVSARAQIPPDYTPCNETGDPEFHSLRPYQASPCGSEVSPYASFCGNKLTLKEIVPVTYPGGGGICKSEGEKVVCKFNISVPPHRVIIDLTDADLPIMGNTEDVASSQKAADSPEFDSAKKVTEYVSWYLNGVLNRAEYGKNNNTDYNAVNFSGPIQKLLPSVIQEAKRIDTVQAASATRHNQIVVCAQEEILGIWGKTKPHDCYQGNNSDAKPNVYRVENWIGDLSELRAALNLINPLDAWNERIPPLPWNFESDILYRKAYNEWRGKSCLILPLLGLTCIDSPLIRNKWAELYSYIPLSSTEDLEGNIKIDSFSSASGDSVKNITFNNQTPSTLFFSHLEESDQLGSILQDTYISKDQQKDEKIGPDVAVEPPSSCTTVDVRSNKGDSLFAKSLSGDLGYTTSFTCSFNPPSCKTSSLAGGGEMCKSGPGGKCTCTNSTPLSRKCPSGYTCGQKCSCEEPIQTCSKTVYIALSTTSNTPKIDDVWSRLVAGPTAIVKRIFPKLGTQIGTLKDMPGSTAINYSGGGVSQSTDLKLPHLGGISEYFLKGIQTMLRPKGYGETISFGETSPIGSISSTGSIDICSDLTNCNQNPDQVDLTGVKEKFIDLANRWLGVGRPRIDMYETVVNSAQTAGVDPIFTLAIWLNESGASNYDGACQILGHSDPSSINCQRAQDFGINNPSKETQYNPNGSIIVDHFTDQLQIFLGLPNYYYSTCKGSSSAKCPMEIFGAMFKWGRCNPTDNSNAYVAGILDIYGWLKPSQTKPCYPIALP